MRVRVRARARVTGTPPPARASRAAAAGPQLRPRPGPARPRAARPPPRMELSAIGEQVFAVESIRKKRVRKVRLRGAAPGTPAEPLHAGGAGKRVAGGPGGLARPGLSPQPVGASVSPGTWQGE